MDPNCSHQYQSHNRLQHTKEQRWKLEIGIEGLRLNCLYRDGKLVFGCDIGKLTFWESKSTQNESSFCEKNYSVVEKFSLAIPFM